MLNALGAVDREGVDFTLFDGIGAFPIFSPDLDRSREISAFADAIAASDGLLIACPEYVRSLPGGLKNAIDWLVSGDEIAFKPIAIAHASLRGDDMLADLRRVLDTVSTNFAPDVFLRLDLTGLGPEATDERLVEPEIRDEMLSFMDRFIRHVVHVREMTDRW